MSRSEEVGQKSWDERLTTLMNNVNAIKAIASAVESTLGPKGLDTMLVDDRGRVIITNDGVTILEKMEVKHPAARMLIKIATAQQEKIGDGTTTATILASSLVQEGAIQVNRGVPVVQVISGIRKGIIKALEILREKSRAITDLQDPVLDRVAFIAAREYEDISSLIMKGARLNSREQLECDHWKLADQVFSHYGEESEVLEGVVLSKLPVSKQMLDRVESPGILILEDALAPEEVDDEALGTELGFKRFLECKDRFKENLLKLPKLGVKVILAERFSDPLAEEICSDLGIALIHRVPKQEIQRLAEHVGAKPIKRTGLNKPFEELARMLGHAQQMVAEERTGKVRFEKGAGKPMATILVGASTPEIVGERERIAKDAASSVQAAIRGGVVPGGGSIELAVSRRLEEWRAHVRGMEGYGVDALIRALQSPLAQMIINAGFNPLEKLEAIRSEQHRLQSDAIGFDFDDGSVANMVERGIMDPTLVKAYALKAAGEVAESILRIHTVIRMRQTTEEEE